MVYVHALPLTAGAQVVVSTHQALESGAVDGTTTAIALDARMEGALRLSPSAGGVIRGWILGVHTLRVPLTGGWNS